MLRDNDPLVLASGEVIRGDSAGIFNLTTEEFGEPLIGSGDEYPPGDPADRAHENITDLILGSSYTETDIINTWASMVDFAQGIDGICDYDLPVGFDAEGRMHIANSNAVILSVINFAGVEIRDIDLIESNPFSDGLPGAVGGFDDEDHGMPTLLGSSDGARPELIAASTELTDGIALLGRDNVEDVMIGTPFADRFYGEQSDSAQTIDTVSYERSNEEVTIDLAEAAGQDGHAEGDLYFGIENVAGSALDDSVTGDGEDNRIEGGLGHDDLFGGEGNDWLYGSFDPASGNQGEFEEEDDGADLIQGDEGDDMLFGGSGPDKLVSTADMDTLDGGPGNDLLDAFGNEEGATFVFRSGSGR